MENKEQELKQTSQKLLARLNDLKEKIRKVKQEEGEADEGGIR